MQCQKRIRPPCRDYCAFVSNGQCRSVGIPKRKPPIWRWWRYQLSGAVGSSNFTAVAEVTFDPHTHQHRSSVYDDCQEGRYKLRMNKLDEISFTAGRVLLGLYFFCPASPNSLVGKAILIWCRMMMCRSRHRFYCWQASQTFCSASCCWPIVSYAWPPMDAFCISS